MRSSGLKFTLIVLVFGLTNNAVAQNTYREVHLLGNPKTIGQELMELGIYIDHYKRDSKGIYTVLSPQEFERLQSSNLNFRINHELIENQVHYPDEKKASFDCVEEGLPPAPENYNGGSMAGFLTYDELLAELDEMASLYPNLISSKSPIGNFTTYEGRPIYWLKISDNPNSQEASEPQVLYTSLHHAREPMSMQQLVYFMWYLLENYASSPEVKALVDETELYFVPAVNPDGFVFNCTNAPNGGGMWRKNRRDHMNGNYGVDNNRNYDFIDENNQSVWGTTGVDANQSGDTYPGSGPFSEVENQAIRWFCENHNFTLAMNNHSYGDLMLYPFGYDYDKPTPENDLFLAYSQWITETNSLDPIISSDLYPASGDSDDWMYGETSTHNKIYALTPEIGPAFWPSESSIESIAYSMVKTNMRTAMLAHGFGSVKVNFNRNNLVADAEINITHIGIPSTGTYTVAVIPGAGCTGSPQTFSTGSLNFNQSESLTASINLKPEIQVGEFFSVEVQVCSGPICETNTFQGIYGAGNILAQDNGQNLNQWSVNGDWNTTTELFVSAPSAFTDSPNMNYGPNTNSSMQLDAEIDLENASWAQASFMARWDIEDNYDFVALQGRVSGSSNWTNLCGEFTNLGAAAQMSGQPLYDGLQNDWVLETVDLSQFLGQRMELRFLFYSDGFVENDGFYFDDFKILAHENLSVNELQLLESIDLFPNPGQQFQLKAPAGLEILSVQIINSLGQTLAVENQVNEQSLLGESHWPAGMYLVRIQTSAGWQSLSWMKGRP